MSTAYIIRQATVDDAGIVAQQRASMFTDMGIDPGLIAARDASFRAWVGERLAGGNYRGWLAVKDDGQVIAGAGLWFYEWIPSPLAPSLTRAYILNVYTERQFRKQGIARRLVEEILAYCRERELAVVLLHASQEGRPIYEGLGFKASNEMRLNL